MYFRVKDGFITLAQLLKVCDVVDSGGAVKAYLASQEIEVNGQPENRRGKKLKPGDVVSLPGLTIHIE